MTFDTKQQSIVNHRVQNMIISSDSQMQYIYIHIQPILSLGIQDAIQVRFTKQSISYEQAHLTQCICVLAKGDANFKTAPQ